MLTLTFLGVGSAFAKRNLQSNALVESWSTSPDSQSQPDDVMLVDFGCTGPIALHELKDKPGFGYLSRNRVVDYTKIQRIFVSHQHADHIGGLEELAFMNLFVLSDPDSGKTFKPQIIAPMDIMVNLWDTSLKGGMTPLPGRYALLQDYFFILALRTTHDGHEPFHMSKRYRFEVFPTDHIRIQREYDWPSYGLLIADTQTDETVFFSGDSRFAFDTYGAAMTAAKMSFHDTQLSEQREPVHALLSELRSMPPDVKKKTFLYHYGDEWDDPAHGFVAEEFAGFAEPQKRYVLFE